MLRYNADLKGKARQLRKNLTDSESVLWSRLRSKQLMGIQFYRQKPVGNYIVDFFAPGAKLVIELDGSQRMLDDHLHRDKSRDEYLVGLGLKVLRFNSNEVLKATDAVVEDIYQTMIEKLKLEISPNPSLPKRGIKRKS
jgi:very-short-patch-repair endonuclease